MDALLSHQPQLETSLKSLHGAWAKPLHSVASHSDQMSQLIGDTAVLADGVSAKVKQLDLAKNRVSSCQQRVHDLIDLGLCSDGVKTALNNEDYEQASHTDTAQ